MSDQPLATPIFDEDFADIAADTRADNQPTQPDDGLPPLAEGKFRIHLLDPITFAGRELSYLDCREPTLGDLLHTGEIATFEVDETEAVKAKFDVAAIIRMASRLSGIAASSIEALPYRNVHLLKASLQRFLHSSGQGK